MRKHVFEITLYLQFVTISIGYLSNQLFAYAEAE